MEVFNPPEQLMRRIRNSAKTVTDKRALTVKTIRSELNAYSKWLFSTACEFYNPGTHPDKAVDLIGQNLKQLIGEMAFNAWRHGSRDPRTHRIIETARIDLATYIGGKGILFGAHDQGSFYKNGLIKQDLERKIRPDVEEDTHDQTRQGKGLRLILDLSDKLAVDTQTGTLYATILRAQFNYYDSPEAALGM